MAALGAVQLQNPADVAAYRAQTVPFYDFKIRDIAIGVLTAVVKIPLFSLLEKGVVDLMKFLKFDLSSPQEAVQIWNSLQSVQALAVKTLLNVAWKALFLMYVVLLGPLVEEYLFRGCLQTWMQNLFANPDSAASIALRIVGNGFTFGLCHLSPCQGWMNVPIFLCTMLAGCIYAALREYTGGTTASSVTHIMNNGIAMFCIIFSP
jgi:membrane protease YdiL (CAAX protease family)